MTTILEIVKRLLLRNKVSLIMVLCATTSGYSKITLSNGNLYLAD